MRIWGWRRRLYNTCHNECAQNVHFTHVWTSVCCWYCEWVWSALVCIHNKVYILLRIVCVCSRLNAIAWTICGVHRHSRVSIITDDRPHRLGQRNRFGCDRLRTDFWFVHWTCSGNAMILNSGEASIAIMCDLSFHFVFYLKDSFLLL